ncbi:hypothetical protein L249_6664 [Ophiocordyceps polyrhachis-furcata BCC 54312]|uniref:Uncharacterized protein n=1 Tax=Ophiocordyceps polyrhachis-furcata BCC 54312 TaxID=1330021 RepID=A0A367LJC2_9HYPO|nr:hypothetical protein L249_6664 [Ophiocordyceps polyrhachis-furcata BCC 54312]
MTPSRVEFSKLAAKLRHKFKHSLNRGWTFLHIHTPVRSKDPTWNSLRLSSVHKQKKKKFPFIARPVRNCGSDESDRHVGRRRLSGATADRVDCCYLRPNRADLLSLLLLYRSPSGREYTLFDPLQRNACVYMRNTS